MGGAPVSYLVPVDDEANMLGHLVVEQATSCVCLVGLPVHPLCTCRSCCLVHALDQRSSDSTPALTLVGEEILKVTNEFNPRGATVIQVVRKTQQPALRRCDKREDGFTRIKEALPGNFCDICGQRSFPLAAIEGVVAVPEGLPSGEVILLNMAYKDWAWHCGWETMCEDRECGLRRLTNQANRRAAVWRARENV